MAGNRSHFQFLKSIVAASLIVPGILVLGVNLATAAAEFGRSVGWNGADAQSLGPLVVLLFAASHTLQAYLFSRQDVLRSSSQVLLSLWPLLFVAAGSALCRLDFGRNAEETQKYVGEDVEFMARRSTLQ